VAETHKNRLWEKRVTDRLRGAAKSKNDVVADDWDADDGDADYGEPHHRVSYDCDADDGDAD